MPKFTEYTTIRIHREIKDYLELLKIKHKFRTLNDVIEYLLGVHEVKK